MKMTGIKWVTLLVLVFGAVSVSAQSDLTVKVKKGSMRWRTLLVIQ